MNTIEKIKYIVMKGKIKKDNEKEREESRKNRYTTFQEFLRSCPEYCISEGFLSSKIRKISGNFQQVVFIDPSSPRDVTAWLKRENDIYYHNGGTYCAPWKSEKKIIYFDVHDMRPLIDCTDDMDWKNQDAVADVVTAVTNARTMGNQKGIGDYLMIAACVLSLIVLLVTIADMAESANQIEKLSAQIQNMNSTILR